MRNIEISTGEIYHVCNRGVDRRKIFEDENDIHRFMKTLDIFNQLKPVGSVREYKFVKEKPPLTLAERLVEILAFAVLPNHYHLLLKQREDNGIAKFMHRLGVGHTKYFNTKYQRTGSLLQGSYKCRLVETNEDLLNLAIYINHNPDIHLQSSREPVGNLVSDYRQWTSLPFYLGQKEANWLHPNLIVSQFGVGEYERFSREAVAGIVERKKLQKELAEDIGN